VRHGALSREESPKSCLVFGLPSPGSRPGPPFRQEAVTFPSRFSPQSFCPWLGGPAKVSPAPKHGWSQACESHISQATRRYSAGGSMRCLPAGKKPCGTEGRTMIVLCLSCGAGGARARRRRREFSDPSGTQGSAPPVAPAESFPARKHGIRALRLACPCSSRTRRLHEALRLSTAGLRESAIKGGFEPRWGEAPPLPQWPERSPALPWPARPGPRPRTCWERGGRTACPATRGPVPPPQRGPLGREGKLARQRLGALHLAPAAWQGGRGVRLHLGGLL